MRANKDIIIYTDGACLGNPGSGGWGAILIESRGEAIDRVKELGGFQADTTNNRMELLSALSALKFLHDGSKSWNSDGFQVRIHTDSKYVIRGATEGHGPAHPDLWKQMVEVLGQFKKGQIHWQHVRGHQGFLGNERVDQIASDFAARRSPKLFEGLYSKYGIPVLDDLKAPKEHRFRAPIYLAWVRGELKSFMSWSGCEAFVKGMPGAKFKKVHSKLDLSRAAASWGCPQEKVEALLSEIAD